jgi:outer membrane protein TolC
LIPNANLSRALRRRQCLFALAAVCTVSAFAQNPDTSAPLPSAPSHILEQQAQSLATDSRTAGSGAVFHATATAPGPEGLRIDQAGDTPLPLSLDDAISFGLARNIRLQYDAANQRQVKGLQSTVFEYLIPNLSVSASSSAQELNLAAMGFNPALLTRFAAAFNLPPSALAGFSTIVKVDVTQAVVSANQVLFNLPDLELYRAAKNESAVIDLNYLNSRGNVVQAVAQAYLLVLADTANILNAQAEERSAQVTFSQAAQKRDAGVGTNLDALRGQVDFQQHQQATIAAQAALLKDTIQLNRIMGLPADQPLELTDTAPFADLAMLSLDDARTTAFAHRKDLLSLEATIDVENREFHAVKYQRLPTLAFNGYYGVVGVTEGLYHGAFTAEGSLRFPIFREAAQRGEQDQISSQLDALRQREGSLKIDIDAQIRAAMLDVQATRELVRVGQSNVDLAQQELSDERDRFHAGIDDNLPVVDAEATLTGAQAQLVQSLYQYNVAKLNLARNTGVIESRYRTYLGK